MTGQEAALMIKGQSDRNLRDEEFFDVLALRVVGALNPDAHASIVEQLRLRDRYRAGEIERKPGAE